MTGKRTQWVAVLALAAVLLAVMAGMTLGAGPSDPDPGTVLAAESFTMYGATWVTNTTTLYGGSGTGEATRYAYYNSLDVFVTVDISGTRTVTVTPQVSADGTNWVDATYSYVGTPLSYVTTATNTQTLSDSSTVTATTTSTTTATVTGTLATSGTATVTSTTTASGTPTVYEATHQVVLSSDGSDYLRVPVVGRYVRPKIEFGGTVTTANGVTVTVVAVARNN